MHRYRVEMQITAEQRATITLRKEVRAESFDKVMDFSDPTWDDLPDNESMPGPEKVTSFSLKVVRLT